MAGEIRVTIRSQNPEQLRVLIQEHKLDLNCGGPAISDAGEWSVEAYVLADTLPNLLAEGLTIDEDDRFPARLAERRGDIGAGDRFQGGKIPPKGLGRKE